MLSLPNLPQLSLLLRHLLCPPHTHPNHLFDISSHKCFPPSVTLVPPLGANMWLPIKGWTLGVGTCVTATMYSVSGTQVSTNKPLWVNEWMSIESGAQLALPRGKAPKYFCSTPLLTHHTRSYLDICFCPVSSLSTWTWTWGTLEYKSICSSHKCFREKQSIGHRLLGWWPAEVCLQTPLWAAGSRFPGWGGLYFRFQTLLQLLSDCLNPLLTSQP